MVTHEVRKRMPLLKAIELTVENIAEVAEFVGAEYDKDLQRLVLATNLTARPGHYLVEGGVSGKWFVHTKDSLEKNFEVWSPPHKHTRGLDHGSSKSTEVVDFPKQKDHPRIAEHEVGRRFINPVEE